MNQEERHRAGAQDSVSVCEYVCICGRDGKYSSHSEHTLAHPQLCHSPSLPSEGFYFMLTLGIKTLKRSSRQGLIYIYLLRVQGLDW